MNKVIIPKGLGNPNAALNVYIENIPPLEQYHQLNKLQAIMPGEIAQIAQLTGNHWRKIFNVFAKLCFELSPNQHTTWQALREHELLQQHSKQCLYFSPYQASTSTDNHAINIIVGRTYAKNLDLATQCHWLNESFAVNTKQRLIICPYFDYRQLSNIKITQLVQLIKQLS